MMNIYITNIKESWIIDRIKLEWGVNFPNLTSRYPFTSKIIWVIAPWAISDKFLKIFKNKKIVYSIFHFEDTSEVSDEIMKIKSIDKYIDAYHVISKQTQQVLKKLTMKPVYFIPLWVNQNIWYYIENKEELRSRLEFSKNDYLIGSFQRDTEGHDLISPKLVKGPDIFVELLKRMYKQNKNIKAVLTGKRRGYIINELSKLSIPFKYYEMTSFEMMNQLYNILDLYLVTSRLEGGPQALVECGQTKTPLISTDVGISRKILSPQSIFDMSNLDSFFSAKPDVDTAFKNSEKLTIPNGMYPYLEMFNKVYEN